MKGSANAHTQWKITNLIYLERGHLSRAGPEIAIEFTISHSDQMAIEIYDLDGRRISSIVNKYFNKGSYRHFWDMHTFSRGCYVVKMQTGAPICIKLIPVVH
jgi:hypothetical protein